MSLLQRLPRAFLVTFLACAFAGTAHAEHYGARAS
jgi:hypothetical protein